MGLSAAQSVLTCVNNHDYNPNQKGAFNEKPECVFYPVTNDDRTQADEKLARLIEHTKYVNEIADKCEG